MSSHDFFGYTFWSQDNDRGMVLIEVYNDVVYEASYVKALDAGWHVVLAATSDTHDPDWISGYEMRAVLLATDLTPTELYAFMSVGRGCGMRNENLRVRFTVNDEVMGSVLDGSSLTFSVWVPVEDPDGDAAGAIT